MKPLACGLMALSLLAVGCAKESPPGGPGAVTRTTPDGKTTTQGSSADTFTLKVPAMSSNVEQGRDKEVTLSIDRGHDFKQKVTVAVEPPAGLAVNPESKDVAPDQKDIKIRIAAAPTAETGSRTVHVTATPETGTAVSETFSVEVKASEPAAPPGASDKKPADIPIPSPPLP